MAEAERAPTVLGLEENSFATRGPSESLSIVSEELARRAAMVVLRLGSPGGDVKLAEVEGAEEGLVDDELIELAPPDETEDIALTEDVLDLVEAFAVPRAA